MYEGVRAGAQSALLGIMAGVIAMHYFGLVVHR